jgi:uncharacterized membrane protein
MFGMNDASEFAILMVLLPLLPAILIFLIFPKAEAFAQGPLQGLTIRAGGAFGAYLIVLLVLMTWMRTTDLLKVPRTWTIAANVIVKNKQGRPIDTRALDRNKFSVSYTPTYIRAIPGRNGVNIKVTATEVDGEIPAMTITYGNVGNAEINLEESTIKVVRHDLQNRYDVITPLEIAPVPPESVGDYSAVDS